MKTRVQNVKTWLYDGRGHRRAFYEGRSMDKAAEVMHLLVQVAIELRASARVAIVAHDLLEHTVRAHDVINGELQPDAATDKLFRLALDTEDNNAH
jgi:hypothetical protein